MTACFQVIFNSPHLNLVLFCLVAQSEVAGSEGEAPTPAAGAEDEAGKEEVTS